MIEFNDLTFNYQKGQTLYDHFSLKQETGKIVGLLGANGAGKSTLLKMMAGLRTPNSGTVRINGFVPYERNPNFLADLYLVPEDFSLPSIRIDRYVKGLSPLYSSFDHDKMDQLLGEFCLKKSERLNQLSHGQRKKFLIAFALATNCKLLLLDEPTNGLDIPSKSIFRKVLVSSVTDEQLVIISTHQVKDIDTIVDKILVVDEGKTVYQENVENIGQKLHFETVSSLQGLDKVLYHEKCPMGHRVILPNEGEEESIIDMELLFNAIVNQKI